MWISDEIPSTERHTFARTRLASWASASSYFFGSIVDTGRWRLLNPATVGIRSHNAVQQCCSHERDQKEIERERDIYMLTGA